MAMHVLLLSGRQLNGCINVIPDWYQIHPFVVHFPTALLVVAPIFVVIGILRRPESAPPFLTCALLLMTLGTLASYAAVWTGRAAESKAELIPYVDDVLRNHSDLAETTRLTFSMLTVVFATIVLVPRFFAQRLNRIITSALPAVFLVLYAAGAVLLVNTAHLGGRLVHEFGITAAHHRTDLTPGDGARRSIPTSGRQTVQTLRPTPY